MGSDSPIEREAAKELGFQDGIVDQLYDGIGRLEEEFGIDLRSRLTDDEQRLEHILDKLEDTEEDVFEALMAGTIEYREAKQDHPDRFEEYDLPPEILSKIDDAYEATSGRFTILDLGCGRGDYHDEMRRYSESLGDRTVELIGIDYRSSPLERVKEAEAVLTDLRYAFPVKDKSIDMVFSNFLKYNVTSRGSEEDWAEIKEQANRALKDGGIQHHTFHYL